MCLSALRRIRRGIKRQQVKNLFAVTFICSVFALTYLEDCRLFAFSSQCEPEFLSVKLNDTFVSFGYPILQPQQHHHHHQLQRNVTGRTNPDAETLEGEPWKNRILGQTLDHIVEESLELKMDPVFEERRDSSGKSCTEMLNEAVERERGLKKVEKNPHVSFSVGATDTVPDILLKNSVTEKGLNVSRRRIYSRQFVDLLKTNVTGVGMPRYFQAEMKFLQNRWIHYHRIIQSTRGPVFNKVVEVKWCPVFKAASTPFLALFTKLSKALTNHTEAAIKKGKMGFLELARTYRLLTPRKYDKDINPVKTTMVVVRHPFKRLLSGYKDKIERVKGRLYYYNKYSTKILRRYRKSKTTELERLSKDKDFLLKIPTFQEFVKFVLSFQPKKLDEHWRPMFLDCNPCHRKFDFILKVETLNEDMKKILKFLHIKDSDPQYAELLGVWTRWNNPSNVGNNKYNRNESFYFSQLTKKEMQRLYKVYEPDFRLFDYSPEPYFSMARNSRE